ncbi:hypothetical protein ACIQNI_28720 [Streptomyces sp. NPDC091266]|uniref:hypothetical protein n=1 Tax=Streptomyces sp. NPDC091266 TaxID=3365978 RepID=UPI0037FDE85D
MASPPDFFDDLSLRVFFARSTLRIEVWIFFASLLHSAPVFGPGPGTPASTGPLYAPDATLTHHLRVPYTPSPAALDHVAAARTV